MQKGKFGYILTGCACHHLWDLRDPTVMKLLRVNQHGQKMSAPLVNHTLLAA